MSTQAIPRQEWPAFFDAFSVRHDRWRITLEVEHAEIGCQVMAREVPLRGISADLRDDPLRDSISISVGEDRSAVFTHTIGAPREIWLEQSEEGADRALAIESTDGVRTLLQFRSAVLPEEVDGVLQGGT